MNKQKAKELVENDINVHRLECAAEDLSNSSEKRAELFNNTSVLRNENEILKRKAGVRMNEDQVNEYWELIAECSESEEEDDWLTAINKLISFVPSV